jgi:hypothetical protein
MLLSALYSEFNASWEVLNDASLKCTKKELFMALTDRLTDKVSSLQVKLTKFKNQKKKLLKTK